jgi:hypothetical protein
MAEDDEGESWVEPILLARGIGSSVVDPRKAMLLGWRVDKWSHRSSQEQSLLAASRRTIKLPSSSLCMAGAMLIP